MKNYRILKFAACLLLIVCVCLPCGTAHAANAEDVFCVTFDNCIPGNEYVLMLLKPGTNVSSIQDSDLLFIDQYTADQGNSMEVALIYPDFEACDAAVSGTFSNNAASPRKLGSFTAAHMPGMLETIEEEAFAGATFTHVYLGNRVSAIGARAFADCAMLAYIYIPASVESIDENTFQGDGDFIIGCAEGSAAEQFARDNGIDYILVG